MNKPQRIKVIRGGEDVVGVVTLQTPLLLQLEKNINYSCKSPAEVTIEFPFACPSLRTSVV